MLFNTLIAVAVLLWAMGCMPRACAAGAKSTSDNREPSGHVSDFDRLMAGLSSRSFIQRDWAARRLMRQGRDTIPRLVAAVRNVERETPTASIVRLLVRMSHDPDLAEAAKAIQGLTNLHHTSGRLPETRRALIAKGYRQVVLRSLGRLTALGADVERGPDGRTTGMRIRSERFLDRHLQWLGPFKSLQQLDLRETGITDEGLEHLKPLESLERLNLSDTRVTAAGLRELPPLPKLTRLILHRISLSEMDVQALRRMLPECDIRSSG